MAGRKKKEIATVDPAELSEYGLEIQNGSDFEVDKWEQNGYKKLTDELVYRFSSILQFLPSSLALNAQKTDKKMADDVYRVVFPDGMNLVKSKKSPNGYRAFCRNESTKEIKAQAELFKIDLFGLLTAGMIKKLRKRRI